MTAWHGRLAVLRSDHADAVRASSADSPDGSAIGTNGAFGIRVDTLRQAAKAGAGRFWRDRLSCLLRAADEAEAALQAPDAKLDAERAAQAEHSTERDPLPPQLEAYYVPSGRPLMLDKCMWSYAREWCCLRCYLAESPDER